MKLQPILPKLFIVLGLLTLATGRWWIGIAAAQGPGDPALTQQMFLPMIARGQPEEAPAPATATVTTTPVTGTPTATTGPTTPTATPTSTTAPTDSPTATPTPTATAPGPDPLNGAWFMEPYTKTGGADIQVDNLGGLHVAYRYHVPDAEGTAAAYLYCPGPTANCVDMNQWQGVKLLNLVREVQLELTTSGQPRLLIQTNSAQYPGGGEDYHYAECNQQCTDPQQWTTAYVATRYGDIGSGISSYYLPDRYFALDPQGRPRFVYNDRNYVIEPDHYGAFYLWCDANCTQTDAWQEVRISQEIAEEYIYDYEIFSFPALTFTQDGRPRVVGDLVPLADANGERDTGIYYFACDAGCESTNNWQRVKLAERGGGPFPMWDIELDGSDRPRVAFYKEDTLAPDESGKRLHYLQCDADCLRAGQWQTLLLGLPRETGDGADLALDANGHPRIAYLDGSYDLGYSWCNGDCLTLANWQHGQADSSEGLEAEYPVVRPITCDAGLWRTHSPAMMLDQAGNPRIAYDASYKARCLYQDPANPGQTYYEFIEIWHAVRVLSFTQPE